jgi:uncharacterized LabA/DUF88 family protein
VPQSVIVFIDYSNMYLAAREVFFTGPPPSPPLCGQFDPIAFANLVCGRRPLGTPNEPRNLNQVRVYVGRPDASRDSKTASAHMRQCTEWERRGVLVVHRPLRYPRSWLAESAKQKGVDVALAVDFVVLAIDSKFDVGIVASADTDLRPAIEYVLNRGIASAEVAAWKRQPRLSVEGRQLWCHILSQNDFDGVADKRDYNIKA